MTNTIATEAINSATYVDNYIDSVENLPDDVQRQLSRIRDIDVQYRGLIRDVDHYYDLYLTLQHSTDTSRRARSISRMHQSLIQAQELGDEKMHIVNHLQEIIDTKLRQLDQDQKNLDLKDELQQQREHLALLDDGQIPLKQSRTQSPMREQGNIGNGLGSNSCVGNGLGGGNSGAHLANSRDVYGAYGTNVSSTLGIGVCGSGGGGGGSSTPNSERSGNGANNHGGAGASNGNLGGSDLQRSGSKRARRRNESMVNNSNHNSLELGGNESNSTNETTGSNGAERNLLIQKSVLGGLGQKKSSTQSGAGGSGTSGAGAGGNASGKKKKRKVRGGAGGGGSGANNSTQSALNTREETPPQETIDPDEPTYCVCNQISFGEMILCDNDLCPIEWFHFSCVSLVLKPKGKWFCPNCRGERPNVMKPKAQFLKELERYNKEKEEKT